MPDPIATAFVLVKPLTTGFTAELTAELNRSIALAQRSVKPIVVPVTTVGGVGNVAQGASQAQRALTNVGGAGLKASKGLQAAQSEANLARGALIGLARVTPVAIFGLGLIGTIAVGFGLAARGAVKQTAELEKELNTLQAVTGATGQQMAEIGNLVRQLGADLSLPATSANDAALALTELAKAGLSIQDSIGGVRGVLQLATAAEISAGDAAKVVATQLNAFGLAGTEAGHIVNTLAAQSIAAQGEITDFSAAFQQVDAVAKTAGFTFDQTAAALTLLAKAGLRGADGGTSLRTTILRLVPTTKQAKEFMHALGIEIDATRSIGSQFPEIVNQMNEALLKLNNSQRIEALNQIFGQDAFRAASIIFSNNASVLADLEAQLRKTGQAQALTEAKTKGLSGAVAGLQSQAETLGTTIGSGVLPVLTSTVDALSDITSGATEAAEALGKIAAPALPALGAIGAGDAVAQTAITVAIGLGIRKLIQKRAEAAKTAATEVQAAAQVVTAQERQLFAQGAIDLSYVKNAQSAVKSGATQTIVANETALANEKAASRSVAAWARAGQNILKGNKLLLAAIATQIAASAVQENTNNQGVNDVASIGGTTAQGAILGNLIVPGAGGVVGGSAGFLLGAFQQSKREDARNRAMWDSQTYMQQQEFIREHFRTTGQLEGFLSIFGFKLKPNPNPAPQFDFGAEGFLGRAKAGGQKIELPSSLTAAAVLGPTDRINFEIAKARAGGKLPELVKALQELIARDDQAIANLELAMRIGTTNRKVAAERIAKLAQERADALQEIFDAFSDPELNPTFANIQIQGIAAGATESLADNIENDKLNIAALQQKLSLALLAGAKTHGIRVELAQAQAQLITDQRAANAKAESDSKTLASDAQAARDAAEHALDVQEENLRFFADQAENQGAAERKLLALLLKRLHDAKGNQEKINRARADYTAELAKAQQATINAAKSSIDLQNQRLETRLLVALQTPGTEDEKRIYNAQIKLLQIQEKNAQRIADAAKNGSERQRAALREVEGYKQSIIRLRQEIKGLSSGSGGFTLNDLWRSAAQQLTDFGSNISFTPMTPGQNVQSVASNILTQKPDSLAGVVASKADKQFALTETTNSILADIRTLLDVPGVQGGTPWRRRSALTDTPGTAADAAKFAVAGVGGM